MVTELRLSAILWHGNPLPRDLVTKRDLQELPNLNKLEGLGFAGEKLRREGGVTVWKKMEGVIYLQRR